MFTQTSGINPAILYYSIIIIYHYYLSIIYHKKVWCPSEAIRGRNIPAGTQRLSDVILWLILSHDVRLPKSDSKYNVRLATSIKRKLIMSYGRRNMVE